MDNEFDDVPLGGLPSADPTLLRNAPLEVAIVDVRFALDEPTLISSQTATAIRDRLNAVTGVEFAHIKPAQQRLVQIELDPSGSQLSNKEGSRGWQILTADGSQGVTVMPDNLIMQTSTYTRWSDSLGSPLLSALEVLAEAVGPALQTRVGLRYIDHFQDSTARALTDWIGRVRPEILGPLHSDTFGGMVRGTQQQLELVVDANHRSILRHGFTAEEDGSTGYLLDIDVFNEATVPFDPERIGRSAVKLNRTALSLFQACVEPTYLRSLQGDAFPEGSVKS
ncbi:TIGR04255 family protein [Curtobacterium sp. MCBA15_008]|uniref:TIGR04255 family protein n=1 Tax=Curtobacterium sp. MCBA15_008 TaxID=1898736 RepID=UPI0008DC724B|nr:TIGR04255 family protein [Curtobacterium sp. MCBA15_008]OII06951.1 hypothetical protein BIU96_05095 [Curtobacterium sp. MCBA15_008]